MRLRTPGVVVYLMAGAALADQAAAAVAGGAIAIEVGIPFSDPLADGPTIQRAGQAALEAGMTPPRCLEAMAATRHALGPDVPLVPMTYAAIVERYGAVRFCKDAASAGASGLIVADVPPEEAGPLQEAAAAHGLDLIQLVSLTSREERIELACHSSHGFVYVVSAVGTTGARESLDHDRLGALLTRVRRHAGSLPVLCGFGVARPEQAAALVEAGADGVIIGSAAIEALETGGTDALERFVRSLASAVAAAAARA